MRVAVIGTGYVGLVTGTCFSEMGNTVWCVDVNEEKIERLKEGIIPIYEPGLAEMVERNHSAGTLNFTTDIAEALQTSEIAFIAVGTPMGEDGSADLQYVLSVAKGIGANMKRHMYVVDKSTVPVGTADKVRATIQAELDGRNSDLTFDVISNPEFLKESETVGFAAPSFGCATEPYRTAFQSALERLTAMGYTLDPGPNVFAAEGIGISNTPAKCAAELTEWYCSDRNQALLSVGGGEMMCEILPHLDWNRLRQARPKWYMGYSDNTNFTYLSATLLDTASIYGPCAASFGMKPWHPAIQDAWDLLTGHLDSVHNYDGWERKDPEPAEDAEEAEEEDPTAPYRITAPFRLRRYEPDAGGAGLHRVTGQAARRTLKMEGRLLGGCVDCLVNLTGTRFDRTRDFLDRYRDDGILWFLESCDLNTFSIRRAMWHMREAGWFDTARGFLIGRALRGGEMFGTDQYASVTDILAPLGVPVVMEIGRAHV